VEGARQNNLKNLTFEIPLNELVVITGLSGSGKTSLAFDTLYAEGQRRYAETFSPYTRQFLERADKPAVDRIQGIPPAIAIGQANSVRTSRSTVGTMTEIADYLKMLFPSMARLRCPHCGRDIHPWTPDEVAADVLEKSPGKPLLILFDVPFPKKTTWSEIASFLQAQGFQRILNGDEIHRLDAETPKNFPNGFLKTPAELRIPTIQDRITASGENRARLAEALTAAFRFGKGVVTLRQAHDPATEPLKYADGWYCPYDEVEFDAPTPGTFSFNNPVGACPACRGFGRSVEIDYDRALPDKTLSLIAGVVKPWQTESFDECQRDLLKVCRKNDIPLDVPFRELSAHDQRFIIRGEVDDKHTLEEIYESGGWYGVKGFFQWLETRAYKMHVRVLLSRYRTYRTCPACHGSRFQPKINNWRLSGKTLPEINSTPVGELQSFFAAIPSKNESTSILLHQIRSRIQYLAEVGLGYLTLDRATRTLSGGEFQRVNLTTCLGTSLVGTLFVLDEPSIGLHSRDTDLLIGILNRLRGQGNTVIVVEHDEQVMLSAGHIMELGPRQGAAGGEIVFQGNVKKLLESNDSLTSLYLSGQKTIPLPEKRRDAKAPVWLEITGANCHNIRDLDIRIPLGRFVCVTGVSGSGKSTLVHEIVFKSVQAELDHPVDEPPEIGTIRGHKNLSEAILVDQSPLAQTPRSTPLLYLKVYDAVRELFGSCEGSVSTGLNASSFSFNSGEGRCPRCQGAGMEKLSMQFLADLFITCPSCNGHRFQEHVLEVRYQGKSIYDVLEMTVEEGLAFFSPAEKIGRAANLHQQVSDALALLRDVGLGYLRLGQPLTHLSGGESQRLKLVSQLVAASGNRAASGAKPQLIILDEPTTGLHFEDILALLGVLNRLVTAGHSLLVIEHHLDVIKCADWVIDLGPEAGEHGGEIVAEGTPEKIAATKASITGKFLRAKLQPSRKGNKGTLRESVSVYRAAPQKDNVISIRGARHHNLKNLSIDIPRNKMVVITGLSGSGKSTLSFDLLFSEGQRRYLDCLNSYARQFIEQMEKPDVDSITGIPPTVAIEQRTSRGGGKSTVATVTELYQFMRLLYAKLGHQHDPETGEEAIQQSPEQIIRRIRAELKKKKELVILSPLIRGRKGLHTEVATWARKKGFKALRVDGKWLELDKFKALERYREHTLDLVLDTIHPKHPHFEALISQALHYGKGVFFTLDNSGREAIHSVHLFCPKSGRSFDELDPRMFSFNSPHGWCPECQGFGFVVPSAEEAETELEKEVQTDLAGEAAAEEMREICPSCNGTRLNPTARAVRFAGKPIAEINRMTVREFSSYFSKLKWKGRETLIAQDIRPEIEQRLRFLEHVGLGYLTLDRPAPTLSGGESQRIRLASQLGSNLQGVLYVLDEPTIGLHPRDNQQLLETLRQLHGMGNSLVIVEHDEDTMREADQIIDLGPGAGINGGRIMAQGSWQDISRNANSATGLLLGNPLKHPSLGSRRPVDENSTMIHIEGARANNLKNVDLQIPLHRLTMITGVSGAGKSTLVRKVLIPAIQQALSKEGKRKGKEWKTVAGVEGIERLVEVDQAPIGKTSRSTVCTYIGMMDDLRELFAQTPEAKMRGFGKGHFSHNSGVGRCPACSGQGTIKVEMNFLPDAYVPCETCSGKRWTENVLKATFREKSIYDVLQLSVDEACEFFSGIPKLHTPLLLLKETGLGYLKLGQTSPTLSGGEAQRIKLVREFATAKIAQDRATLRSRQTKIPHTLYVLEEPTVGLHLADVQRLTELLHRLVEAGHTVVVVEHHLDLIAEADHVIDVGPESGEAGGEILFSGTPENLCKCRRSHTGKYLQRLLER